MINDNLYDIKFTIICVGLFSILLYNEFSYESNVKLYVKAIMYV